MDPIVRSLSPRQDARPAHQERPLPTPYPPSASELENLAPLPEIRDHRLRNHSDDSTTSNTSISHLPPLPPTFHTTDHQYKGRTSEPSPLQSSIGYSMSKLLNLSSFTSFLNSQNGYQDFWEYLLAYSSPHLHTLELQRDLQALIRLTSHSSAAAKAMRDVYCTPSGEKKVVLKADLAGDGEHDFMSDMGDALLEIAEPPTGLERASRHLLQELYANEFEAFVKHRLLAHTKLQLEKRDLNKNDVAGLGEAFVLSNPKLHDCPIVLASPAFSALTGYTQEEIIGRNCRFLQGESTSPESVHEIRQAIKEQRAITQLLLNYDKSGAPFFNLLCIVPLFSPAGELIYFIGGQTDVTGALGNGSRLALPGRNPYPEPILSTTSSEIDLSAFSPVVQTSATYSSTAINNSTAGGGGEQPPRSDSRASRNSSDSSNHTEVSSVAPSVNIQPKSSSKHYGSELVDPSTASSSTNSSPSGNDKKFSSKLPIRPKPFSRSSTSNLNRNSFLGPKSWTLPKSSNQSHSQQTQQKGSDSTGSGFTSTSVQSVNGSSSTAAPKLEYKQGTVERRIHEFQTTYEKVILVSRIDRKILFNTGAFLRFCGLPASTSEQIDNSCLISTDLLDVVKGPGGNGGGSEVRQKIAKAFEEGKPCSVRCGIKVEEKKLLFKTRSAIGHPTAEGVLHMTPMKDINDRTTAYVAIPNLVTAEQNGVHFEDDAAQLDEGLGDWAPTVPPLEQLPPSNVPTYLPTAPASIRSTSTKSRYQLTSKPFNLALTPNQESMNYSLARLLSRPRFASFISTPLGYSQFKAYLSEHGTSEQVAQLDLWRDLNILSNLKMQTAFWAKGISKVYKDEIGTLPRQLVKELIGGLRSTASEATSGSLSGPAKHLLDSFYATQFESFMKSRLVRHTREQLTRYHLHASDARTGIGEAYVLVNPRLQDRPIVLVSPGFETLTGYKASQIIGRNCRFLQGKSTSPAAVKAIKQAVDAGSDITQLVLNYTAEARPFMNLLTMIALHDVNGNLTYFIGGQSDLTEAMTTTRGPVSLLQSGEEIFNTDLNQLSEPVLLEAREAATNHDGLEIELPVGTTGGPSPSEKESNGKHDHGFEKLKTLCYKLVGKKLRTPLVIEEPHGPLVPPSSILKAPKAIDAIASNYSSTYDKLLVVKQNREILFATSGFLRHVALPGTTRQDVDKSPLVHLDLLEIIVDPTNPKDQLATKELRDQIRLTILKGVQASFSAGIQYRGAQEASIPLVSGRLYISPLNDLFGEPAASSVVFA